MTTYTIFSPAPNSLFQFTPTLDGQQYNAIITWNLAGQRWYLNLYTLSNVLVLSIARVGSPDDYDINLVAGFFSSSLVFRESSNQFEVSP